jgi:cell division protein FtsW (lipid II flippase)
MFVLFFILSSTRSIEQIKWISFSAPAFFIYFLIVGFKENNNKELRFLLILISLFSFWSMITSFWSFYPKDSFIRSFIYLISSWCIILGGFCWVKYFNKKDFGFMLPLNILLVTVSLFSLMSGIPFDYWAGYGFGLKSFWGHQNTLASLIIFTIPGIFILPSKDKKFRTLVTWILFVLNIYILVLTHSRTSLVVLLSSIVFYSILIRNLKFFGVVILIYICITVVYFTNNGFHNVFNNYLFKTENSLLDRKKSTIIPSYEAAGHGGWKGLGFGVSDTTVLENLQLNSTYHFEGARLVREKTVSIFALIEETGWVGLTLFLLFVGYLFYLVFLTYLKTKDWTSALMICVLLGMCVHAQFEGWWVGVGSVQFPLFMGIAGIAVGRFEKNLEQK